MNDDLVYRIQKSIYCELRQAVVAHNGQVAIGRLGTEPLLPDDWGAQLTLFLTADETGSLNPSLGYNKVLRNAAVPGASPYGQSFSLPFSATLSSQAVRKDTYYSFYTAKGLKLPIGINGDNSCSEGNPADSTGSNPLPLDRRGSSFLLSGNVGIARWLNNALIASAAIPSSLPGSVGRKSDILQYDIKFIVLSSASVNPTLKLVSFFMGGSVPLLSANRTRTHELLLTFGPTETANNQTSPTQRAQTVHQAGEIYSAVSSGFQSVLNAQP